MPPFIVPDHGRAEIRKIKKARGGDTGVGWCTRSMPCGCDQRRTTRRCATRTTKRSANPRRHVGKLEGGTVADAQAAYEEGFSSMYGSVFSSGNRFRQLVRACGVSHEHTARLGRAEGDEVLQRQRWLAAEPAEALSQNDTAR
jgi:hypothetical protein